MPLDVLSDGFVRMCFDTSLNFFDGKCRILVEGQYVVNPLLATPIVPDVPIRVTSTRYVDDMFTAGSVLAESLKTVFKRAGESLEVFALPRLDAVGAVKAVYTLVVTGPATSSGNIDIFLGNEQYSITGVDVTNGDTDAVIATAIAAEIAALDSFPYVVTDDLAGNLTFTARNGGTVGNFLNPVVNWRGFQNYYPSGVSIAVAQATPGSVDPAPVDYSAALGDCCYSCYVLLGEANAWQEGLVAWLKSAWDCSKPQCFGHGYTYNSGTAAAILTTFENAAEISKLAIPANDVNFPWQMVADYAANSCALGCVSPELSFQGRTYGVMQTVMRPTDCTLPWSYDDMVSLQQGGFVTYAPLAQGSGLLTSPYVVNDITNWLYDEYNRPNATFRDTSSRRLATKTAIRVAEELNTLSGLALYTKNTRVPQGVFGTNLRLVTARMHNFARSQVGILWSEFDSLEKDIVIKDDFSIAQPCQGVPCKLHMFMRYRPPCRISNVSVKLQPKLLDNCRV